MDPFRERMIRRCQEEKSVKSKNGESGNILFSTFEVLVDDTNKLLCAASNGDRAVGNLNKMNNNEVDSLNIETEKIVNNFLHDALGSTLTLYSEDSNPSCHSPESKHNSAYNEERNEDIAKQPLHYTVHGYRAMTKKKQIKTRSPLLSTTFNVRELKSTERTEKEKYVKNLEENILREKNVLYQTTKALKYCCSSASLSFSSQRAEWERLLLLSSCRYKAMERKMKLLKVDILAGCPLRCENGKVTLSNMYLKVLQLSKFQNEEVDTWFIILVSHEEKVEATQVYQLSNNQLSINLTECFTFNNLSNDFIISIQLFSLQLKHNKKVHKHYFKAYDSGWTSVTDLSSPDIFKTSDFHLEHSFNLGLKDLKSSTVTEVSLGISMGFNLTWDVESKVHLSGFLAVRKNVGEYKVWDRKWCLLEGCVLKYWNYPSDKEQKAPLGMIDLRQCITSCVKTLDREIDPWHKTFIIETVDISCGSAKKAPLIPEEKNQHFFRADSKKELVEWCMVLNKHLDLLRKWKVLKN